MSLDVRIPAAIKKAEADVAYHKWAMWYRKKGSTEPTDIITATEVALAKEFYEFSAATQMLVNAVEEEPPDVIWPAALCAFTEKIEKLA